MSEPPPGRLRAQWQRLGPGVRRGLVLVGGSALGAGLLAFGVWLQEPAEPVAARRQKVVQNLLTDVDPRSLGLEGLAEQLRRLEGRTTELARTLERLGVEDRARTQVREEGATRDRAQGERALEDLRAEVGRLQAEIDRARSAPPVAPTAPAVPAPEPSGAGRAGRGPAREPQDLFATPPLPAPALPATRPGAAATAPPVAVGAGGLAIRVVDARSGQPAGAEAGKGTPATPEDAVFVTAGSILRGVLLTGMDAPTGQGARRDPYPALARVKHEAILPNRFRADVRECFLVAAGYGDLSSERAYLRTESLSCVRSDGGVIEVPVEGYAVGEDGKLGLRGRLVSKQGQVIARAMQVGFLEGFAGVFTKQSVPVIATSAGATTPFQSALSADAVQGGVVAGAGKALDRLANYYLDMADAMFPVIEVDAGRGVEFVLNRGTALRLRGSGAEAAPRRP